MIRGTFFGHTECPSNEMFTNIVPSVSCPYLVVCLLLQHVEGGFGINIARRPTISQCVCVRVFFESTDQASTIPSNIRGCQSGTWSAGQEKIRGTSTKLQREHENKNDKKKGTKTQCTWQNL